MNVAVPMHQKAAPPPTAEQLAASLAELERAFIEAQRSNNRARTELGGHVAGGDAAAIADCRREIARAGTMVTELAPAIEAGREAIRIAQARERALSDAQAYRVIKKLVADTRDDFGTLADSIVAFAQALKKCGLALDSTDATMRNSGVTPDPYVLRAKFMALVEMSMHLATEGRFGVARTLENAHQLHQSGRADLKRAAAEYQALYLQRARATLHIASE